MTNSKPLLQDLALIPLSSLRDQACFTSRPVGFNRGEGEF